MAFNFLLVDDSSIVRKSFTKVLNMTDIEVAELHEAENGQVGLEKLREEWIDLVFLDINMPIMNGIEMLEAVRADDALKQVPVVIVSTEGSEERIEYLKELGIQSYIRKPYTPEVLAETVTEILGGK